MSSSKASQLKRAFFHDSFSLAEAFGKCGHGFACRRVTAPTAMALVPRISRAQSMDALSSQALVAGYLCGIVGAGLLRRFFPSA